MRRMLGVFLFGLGTAIAAPTQVEDMAKPGHPGWQSAEGTGCLVWNSAPVAGTTVTWSGACKGKKASGQGELVWRYDGMTERYFGDMQDGKPHGTGAFTSQDGGSYDGQWADGKFHGSGARVWPNGGRYEGDYINGKQTGHGVESWPNGERYEGDYVDGRRTGRGIYVWPNGNRYEGDWLDGKQHGRGTFVFEGGDRYEGEYVHDKRTGRGTYTWPNGDRYEGDYVVPERKLGFQRLAHSPRPGDRGTISLNCVR